jgi:hypothetical protein
MSLAALSITISVGSFALSAVVAWLTLLRRGTVRMVRPALVAFLDARGTDGPKVWFRAMLYSTAQKGNVIESMYVRLRRGEAQQNFSFWVCGDARDRLAMGSGLFVGQNGVSLDHHFVLPKDGTRFDFVAGDYVVEVFASLVNRQTHLHLARIPLHLSDEHAKALKNPSQSIYFNWWPDSAKYHAHIGSQKQPPLPPEALFAGLFAAQAASEEPSR